MNITRTLLEQLRILGLTTEEARIYVELLKEPTTHLKLAHATGVNRTKVYRLIDDLEKRSLVSRRVDDRGTFLTAADPSTLEVVIIDQEQKVGRQRRALEAIAPTLAALKAGNSREFILQTYEGIEGFKQMLWHELKTKDENLIFGGIPIEHLVPDRTWAEKHRQMTVEAGYAIRELINPAQKEDPFTQNHAYMQLFKRRNLNSSTLGFDDQLSIYNDTVSAYHWRNGERVGFEVISDSYTAMMRQLFEHYWQLAKE